MEIDERLLYPPTNRAAYSDRMAWLMAEMSKLAYKNFESDQTKEQLIKDLAFLKDKEKISEKVEEYKEKVLNLDTEGQKSLADSLSNFKFELVETFDKNDTQAFIAKRETDKIAVLSFRGTEKDIGDIKVRFYTSTNGVKIHNGFYLAFQEVEEPINQCFENLSDYTIYITGHSLGGALALIAASYLNFDNIGACYTFGSPKVGNLDFGDNIKTPIYRIVNAADIVTRIPSSLIIDIFLLFAKILPVPFVRSGLINILSSVKGYTHHGDMRYLTACKPDYSDLKVISNIDFVSRVLRFFSRISKDFKSAATDHLINNYREKLKFYALKRLEQK